MKVAYFDCSRGISGVATLAALIDAGADMDLLSAGIEFLGDGLPILRTEDRTLGAFRVRTVSIEGGEASVASRPEDLEMLLSAARLPDGARDLARRIYGRLAAAEARVHGTSPKTVTFHEIGSLRSVVGVVGTAIALEQLGIQEIVASPAPIGRGTVDTEHGRLALPTPATLELLRGVPIEPQVGTGELVTPTGAAIFAVAATSFGPIPAMTIESVGYGMDGRQSSGPILRVVVGRAADGSVVAGSS